jgi:RNA polymerase sigma-70 factor (ECF subfamily)
MPPSDSEQGRWFAAHVQPHEGMLRAWLANRFGTQLAIDDVIQESYMRLLRARAEGGELHSPKAFLFATARNLALDYVRRHHVARTDPLVETDFLNVLDDQDVTETVARNQELALLTEAIQTLPARCRQVFTLRTVYGLSQREIAEKLGISDRTVAAQLMIGVAKCTEFMVRYTRRRPLP